MSAAPIPSADLVRTRRSGRLRQETTGLILLSAGVSATALWLYSHRDVVLLYGDAVAHINIARRIFDSRTPGVWQLGTVWLPLPHILDIPFVISRRLWQTGLGGAIPSALAYVLGTLGVFRLVRSLASRFAAWVAALIYCLNPNLIYLQATAMTEALYLAWFIWATVYFCEFVQRAGDDPPAARRSLEKCGMVTAAAMLVRYDGWFLAAVIGTGAVLVVVRQRIATQRKVAAPIRRGVSNFALLTVLTGGVWLSYNYAAYGNALEFANGPYSAHAIERRTRPASMPTYPGEDSPRTAAVYFLKVSRLNLGAGWMDLPLMAMAFIALLAAIYFGRKFLPCAVLWTPAVFYVANIAWGSVPIYCPQWWPFSFYNVRYGLEMLPAVAVFVGAGCELLSRLVPARWVVLFTASVTAASYLSIWQTGPICLQEAEVNGRARMTFDRQLAEKLNELPQGTVLMMDCGAHSGALQAAGIPFRRVLRESNPPDWEIALAQPARAADYVVAVSGDQVSFAVRLFPQDLEPVARAGTASPSAAIIYRSRAR